MKKDSLGFAAVWEEPLFSLLLFSLFHSFKASSNNNASATHKSRKSIQLDLGRPGTQITTPPGDSFTTWWQTWWSTSLPASEETGDSNQTVGMGRLTFILDLNFEMDC